MITYHPGMQDAIDHFVRIPKYGTPVSELTERDKLALCIAAGVEFETSCEPDKSGTYRISVKLKRPAGVVDLGDGKFTVFVGPNPRVRARV